MTTTTTTTTEKTVEYQYHCDRYLATPDTAKDVLARYGVAIVPSVLDADECAAMNAGMWDALETLSAQWPVPMKRDCPESWRSFRHLFAKHSMLLQHWGIGHAQYAWDVRQNAKVAEVFAKLWQTPAEDLLVSFDGVACHLPPEVTRLGWFRENHWLHCDQSFCDSDFQCVQGWVTANDTREGDATLAFLEGSHALHSEFARHAGALEAENRKTFKDDWLKLTAEQRAFYTERGCAPCRVVCPRGSLVLWDSRTIHCGTEAVRGRAEPGVRNVVYVCYQPRAMASERQLAKKRAAFEQQRLTSHWPCKVKLFPKMPRTYGEAVLPMTELPAPRLNALGLRLAGMA